MLNCAGNGAPSRKPLAALPAWLEDEKGRFAPASWRRITECVRCGGPVHYVTSVLLRGAEGFRQVIVEVLCRPCGLRDTFSTHEWYERQRRPGGGGRLGEEEEGQGRQEARNPHLGVTRLNGPTT